MKALTRTPPITLTIAGSDSGGGAGIQADLKTFAALQCFGTTVITAVTAQNTLGVRAVHPIPVEVIAAQLDALSADLAPAAVKTGMLATREVVETVADGLVRLSPPCLIVDPVMVATSGDALLDADAVQAVRDRLLPLATCLTPNLDEAEILTGLTVRSPDAMVAAGRALVDLGARAVLIKGGHLKSDILVDVLVTEDQVERFIRRRIPNEREMHGTGCTLSAAICAEMAQGAALVDAIPAAIEYLRSGILAALPYGKGSGLLWHGHLT